MSHKSMSVMLKDSKQDEMIPLTFDEAARIMFANQDNITPLALLLSLILKENQDDLKDRIQIINPYVPNKDLGEKKTERDIVVRLISDNNYNDQKIVLEINFLKEKSQSILDRNMLYLEEVFSSGLKESESYSKIKSSLLINLNTFFVDYKNKPWYDAYYYCNEYGYIYSKKQRIININIADCYQKCYNQLVPEFENLEEKKLFYLCAAMLTKKKEEFNDLLQKSGIDSETRNNMVEVCDNMNDNEELKLRYYDINEERRRIYEAAIEDSKEMAREEGIQQGIQEGIEQNKKEMVLNLNHNGVSLDIIAKSSNLTIDEVKAIIDSE